MKIVTQNLHLLWQEDVPCPAQNVEELLQKALNELDVTLHKGEALDKPYTLSVKFSDNHTVQQLNKKFRGKDKPTNVLSFPNDEEIPGVESDTTYIGDIILAKETVEAEAGEQSKSFESHLAHLLIHGILHLYGFDHMEDEEAEEMEALEVRILGGINIANPYN